MPSTAARPAPRPTGYADREVTQPPNWHELVVWDLFLNAAATGLFLVAAVGELARPDLFGAVRVWAYPLALILLLADLSCLVFDLGQPTRFHHMLRVFKPSSPMSLGTWFLTAYSLPLTLLVALDVFGLFDWLPFERVLIDRVRTVLLVVGLPLAFGSGAYKGVLFSTTAQPGWRDARWLGAYHLSSALAVGCGLLLVLSVVTGHDGGVAVLRPTLALLVALNLIPLGMMAAELWPTLARVRSRPGLRRTAFGMVVVGVALPLGFVAIGGGGFAIAASVGVLAVAYAIRSVVVHLPHAIRHLSQGHFYH